MEKTLNFLCLLGDRQGEKRPDIQLNSFGFYTNGSLEVDLSLLRLGLQETKEKTPLVRGWGGFLEEGEVHSVQAPLPPVRIHILASRSPGSCSQNE